MSLRRSLYKKSLDSQPQRSTTGSWTHTSIDVWRSDDDWTVLIYEFGLWVVKMVFNYSL